MCITNYGGAVWSAQVFISAQSSSGPEVRTFVIDGFSPLLRNAAVSELSVHMRKVARDATWTADNRTTETVGCGREIWNVQERNETEGKETGREGGRETGRQARL